MATLAFCFEDFLILSKIVSKTTVLVSQSREMFFNHFRNKTKYKFLELSLCYIRHRQGFSANY